MQTLLSVMEQGDPLKLLEKLNIKTDAVIVNQCGREDERSEAFEGRRIRIIERAEKGLSRSRNLALSSAVDDICIFCDNDVRYVRDAKAIIEQAFGVYKDAGIICFFIERPERHEPVRLKEGDMTKTDMMRIFSPEIAVRRSKLRGLSFDEDFGAGAKYGMGEENIFLFEAARRRIRRVYIPVKIAETIPNESTWFRGYDRKFFFDRGAGYEAMDQAFWYPLCLQFLIRKKGLYRDSISAAEAYKAMKEGRREYREYRRNKGS